MPYYEYICTECERRFDQYRKVTDPPLSRCPKCRGRVRKVFQPVGIIFKGSGFHSTDYRSSDYQDRAKEDSPTSGGKAGAAKSSKEDSEK